MDELQEKIGEARGLLSNLIFGKKAKKPRDLIHTIQAYLQYLSIQQSQLALLSPNSQQHVMAAAAAAAAANNAQLLSPAGHHLSVHSLNTPLSSATSAMTPSANSMAHTQTVPMPSPMQTAGTPHAAGAAPVQSPMALNVLSPPYPPINVMDGNGVQATPTGSSSGSLGTPHAGSAVPPTPSGAIHPEALPQSITAELDAIVIVLYGDTIIDLMFEADLFRRVLEQLRYLEFEARKFFTRIFEYALTQRRELSVPYILRRRHMLLQCIHAYEEKDVSIALSCDAILRACIACEPITELMLQSGSLPDTVSISPTSAAAAAAAAAGASASVVTPSAVAATASTSDPSLAPLDVTSPSPTHASHNAAAHAASSFSAASLSAPPAAYESGNMVLPFFRYLHLPTFINSHAFATFKLLLTAYPSLSAAYLRAHYDSFFRHYNQLLCSPNYATKVQSFAFLGELLMERHNQEVMMRYVNEAEHLKLAMHALRGPRAIQLAVFGVLKIFVPNPYKSEAVARILTQNKRNFLAFLDEFERETEDETMVAHKAEMIQALNDMPDSVPPLVKKVSQAQPTQPQTDVGQQYAQQEAMQQQMQQQHQHQQQYQQQQQQHQHAALPSDLPLSPSEEMP